MGKFIINFTPTGMIPTKEMTAHVPLSPDEIIEDVLKAKTMGASIVHLHARDQNGKPTWKKEVYREIISGIREADGYNNDSMIICVSTSGRNWPDFERRSDCMDLEDVSKPEMASLTLSSLNFADAASTNSPQMIQKLAGFMRKKGIKPELEIFDSGMINYAKYLIKNGLISPPYYFNIILGNIASAQATLLEAGNLLANLPDNSYWAFGGIGSSQLKMNVTGMAHGGGIRIGLEDNVFFDEKRTRKATNIELLERMVGIAERMGAIPYAASEVRELLDLKI